MLEFTGKGGKALLAPYCKINGQDVLLKKMIWSSRFFWLPVFSGQAGVLAVRGKIFAPPGHRGAVYLLEVRNAGGKPLTAEAGFKVCCAGVSRRIFRTVPIGRCRMEWDEWTKSLVLLAGREVPLAARVLPLQRFRALANRNLFFNYFFALGKTVDTDQLAAVTSRSPRYYVSAAFWGRDCLLWSFPGVLLAARDRETGLYATFLDPSDDQPSYPFLVYDNALAERAFSFLAGLQENGLTFPQRMTLMAGELRAAILRHGVVDGPFGPMFAWAVNGKGNYELYDVKRSSPSTAVLPPGRPLPQAPASWPLRSGTPWVVK